MATRAGRGATAARTRMRRAARTRASAAGTRPRRGGMRLDSLRTLYVEELRDLYDAEHQILKALPRMIQAASHDEVRRALEEHRSQTEEHVRRLERVFEASGVAARASRCEGMAGVLQEGTEIVQAAADPDVRDAGIIGSAQKVEHYEIAGYGTVRTYARQLNMQDAARWLQQTLDEEKQADKRLTEIAEQAVNVHAGEDDEEVEDVGLEEDEEE